MIAKEWTRCERAGERVYRMCSVQMSIYVSLKERVIPSACFDEENKSDLERRLNQNDTESVRSSR